MERARIGDGVIRDSRRLQADVVGEAMHRAAVADQLEVGPRRVHLLDEPCQLCGGDVRIQSTVADEYLGLDGSVAAVARNTRSDRGDSPGPLWRQSWIRFGFMGASLGQSAAWVMPAVPSVVGQLRHRAAAFAAAAGASEEVTDAIALAVSETVTNVIVHAYDGEKGEVRVSCDVDGERVTVEVVDYGSGIAARQDSPGIGHGLATVGALAQSLDIALGPDGRGTVVTMAFGRVQPLDAPPGLEALCALALATVADVSSVHLVRDGVLRRVAAEVAGEPALSAWLREALPPAKPGTATWAALREGAPRLVVHDPSVPRSPVGPGERLGLTWWLAIPLEKPDGTPAALWGLGGRLGGRSVPSEKVIHILADAAAGDLAQPAGRALLRARLATARS